MIPPPFQGNTIRVLGPLLSRSRSLEAAPASLAYTAPWDWSAGLPARRGGTVSPLGPLPETTKQEVRRRLKIETERRIMKEVLLREERRKKEEADEKRRQVCASSPPLSRDMARPCQSWLGQRKHRPIYLNLNK